MAQNDQMVTKSRRITVTKQDLDVMSRTIYGEARGSSHLDRIAVAFVIINRSLKAKEYIQNNGIKKKIHPLFGDGSIKSACLMPYQFSCWNKNDPNSALLESLSLENDLTKTDFRNALLAALYTVQEFGEDPTHGCLHYHHKDLAFPKSWGSVQKPDNRIGAHLYYKNIA